MYIARMDSDDVCFKNRFKEQVKLLEKNDVVGSNVIFIDENGNKMGDRDYASKNIAEIIKYESPLAHPSTMFRHELIKKYGAYRNEFTPADDYDIWLRFWSYGAKIKIINKNLLYYRQHANTVKNLKTKKTIKQTIKVKQNAKREYKIKFGIKGNIRIIAEKLLLILPRKAILSLFYLIKGRK
jgi:hypothetical protein